MDLKGRIAHAESEIARVQTELNSLHSEAQHLQRQSQVQPSSMDARAISVAAKQSAQAEAEVQPKLAGIHSAVAALQPVLGQYQRELAGLKLQQKEIEELRLEREAKDELEKCGQVLNELSAKMQDAMLALHQSGAKLNSLRGLGGSVKYQAVTNSLPVYTLEKGCHYLSYHELNFRQADENPLARPAPANPALASQRTEQLQLQFDANQLEVRIGELREEIAGCQSKLSQFQHHRRGPEVSWSAALRHSIGQKEAQLEEAEQKLKALRTQIGATNVAR